MVLRDTEFCKNISSDAYTQRTRERYVSAITPKHVSYYNFWSRARRRVIPESSMGFYGSRNTMGQSILFWTEYVEYSNMQNMWYRTWNSTFSCRDIWWNVYRMHSVSVENWLRVFTYIVLHWRTCTLSHFSWIMNTEYTTFGFLYFCSRTTSTNTDSSYKLGFPSLTGSMTDL